MKKTNQALEQIPVFAIPIVNRGDLLLRLVASMDFPVKKLYIVNNGNDATVADAIKELKAGFNPLISEVEEHTEGRNLGVAAAWNAVIRNHPDAPFWIISANDMVFTQPGDLEKMYRQLVATKDTHHLRYADGYSCFAVTSLGRDFLTHPDTPGMFDENIWPAYFEDDDHFYRIKLSGAVTENFTGFKMKHGTGIAGDKDENGSATIAANPAINKANGVLFQSNALYYERKWGGRKPNETFIAPYGNPETSIHFWEIDTERQERDLKIWDAVVNGEADEI